MNKATKNKLEAKGWKVGTAQDFLGLTDAEEAFIETKLALAAHLRSRRLKRNLNQTQVAKLIGSSQSRVAKMEAADPSVSVDLLMRALLKLGVDRKDLARAVAASV
jgi:predicted XRE-type DNA-binding protein